MFRIGMNNSIENKRDIKAVILDSGFDFGRCPLASRLPAALWPVASKASIEHLLQCLSDYGVKQTIICSNTDDRIVKEFIEAGDYRMDLRFSEFKLPTGTAGSFRDAVCGDRSSLWLILPAGMVNVPDIEAIIQSHYRGRCELTVVLNPADTKNGYPGQATGIYVCDPVILDSIPAGGYYDIKESLIPELLRAGKNIYAARLPESVGNFRNYTEYLSAVCGELEKKHEKSSLVSDFDRVPSKSVWTGLGVNIPVSVRIYGPVVIMEGASISEGAVIFGPTIIGRYAAVGENSLIVNSILWDNSCVSAECRVERCVIGSQAVAPCKSVIHEQAVLPQPHETLRHFAKALSADRLKNAEKIETATCCRRNKFNGPLGFITVLLLAVFIWSNWFTLKDLWGIWQRSDEYSSGLLVPFLAAYILWVRREGFASCRIQPSLWGLPVFAAAQAIKFAGLFFMYSSMERFSIVVSVAGLLLLLFGWNYFQKTFTILLFLCLMLPLPASIHSSLLLPLQSWSTASAVFCLEVMGYDVIRTGNIIDVNGTTVAVIEACNGLRMIMAFFVIGGFIVLLSRRAKWEKLLVFLSGVPIALLCNTVRLTVTAIAFTYVKGEYWEKLFHDFGGYAMMPFAIGIIVLEFWLLAKMVTVGTGNQLVPD
jgi:exosortase